METSRGRWFLGEYAKRNRNADTSMVLDAVARIEDALAAQRQQQPAPDTRFEAALAAFRSAVDQADAAVSTTLDGLALEQNLAPILKGARIVREISWRWREIGADGRICDLLDSQVGAIEAGCEQISSSDPRPALRAAFELIRAQIEAFGEADAGPATEAVAPAAPPPHEKPVAVDEVEADAHDEALLDLVAMEMAAPDGRRLRRNGAGVRTSSRRRGSICRAREWRSRPPKQPPWWSRRRRCSRRLGPPPNRSASRPPEPRPPREAAAEPSLGSTIIESGILRKTQHPGQRSAGADPAHEPDREDRVLLLERPGRLARSLSIGSRHPFIRTFIEHRFDRD